jgi:hypothetical protein
VLIKSDHLQTFILANQNFKINVKPFFSPYVNGTDFSATGKGKYNSLKSSGAYGRSIFWKLGPK